ncbi:MAG TPA: amino acid ABC transporter permease [Eggerthellaceae bacterium]|nr:amino acid ABC transporter permease [Eggerthellaceae bacterium]
MGACRIRRTGKHMNSSQRRAWRAVDLLLTATLIVAVAMSSLSGAAFALGTASCTARPNGETGSEVHGGVETRITWEGQAAEDESVKAISLSFPEGTSFEVENARFTILQGADLMTRVNAECEFAAEGQSAVCTLAQPADAGSYFRIEIYGVVFPVGGGDMELTGTYELADGTTKAIDDIDAIPVAVTSPTQQLANYLEEQPWVQAWNSNKFLRLFLNPPILVSSFPVVLGGFFMAIAIVFVAFPLAIPVGLMFSFMRMSKLRILRALGSLYVNVVRGTPVFLQIYIAFFGLPLAGIKIPPFIMGVIVLALNSAAYQCEIFRAGIQSINKGQFEAARSLGMTGAQTMMFVIIPQTIRRVLPTMTSEFILLYKDTSMLAAVGIMEIVLYAKTIVASTGSITPYIVAAVFYLVLTIPLANLVGRLEERLAGNDTGAARKNKKRAVKEAKRALNPGVVAAKLEEPPAPAGSDDDRAVSPERLNSM